MILMVLYLCIMIKARAVFLFFIVYLFDDYIFQIIMLVSFRVFLVKDEC